MKWNEAEHNPGLQFLKEPTVINNAVHLLGLVIIQVH